MLCCVIFDSVLDVNCSSGNVRFCSEWLCNEQKSLWLREQKSTFQSLSEGHLRFVKVQIWIGDYNPKAGRVLLFLFRKHFSLVFWVFMVLHAENEKATLLCLQEWRDPQIWSGVVATVFLPRRYYTWVTWRKGVSHSCGEASPEGRAGDCPVSEHPLHSRDQIDGFAGQPSSDHFVAHKPS